MNTNTNTSMSMSISVLIVEDVPEFQRRFADAVRSDPGLSLLGLADSGAGALEFLGRQVPDVMLVDLGLPDMSGIEVIRHAARHHPATEALVVTMFGDDASVLASIEAGATGYLLKDSMPESIASSIHELVAGGSPISPSIARRVLTRFRSGSPAPAAAPVAVSREAVLTERETDILRQVAKGMSFAEIGEILTISQHTVVAHVKKIYRKLAVHSRGEAVFEANQMGLL
jgi:DNA-binding NarL/FixJ family response regulator